MEQNVENQIIEIVRKITHNSYVDINSTHTTVEGWDSLAYLLIVQKIEELFDIEISTNNIDRFDSIQNVLEIINENKGSPSV